MIGAYLRMVAGVAIMGLSYYPSMRLLKRFLQEYWGEKERIHTIVPVVMFALMEIVGTGLAIDPIVPGQSLIHINAQDLVKTNTQAHDLRVELAVLNFDGTVDDDRRTVGRFDERGLHFVLINFDWFQSYVQITVFRQSAPEQHLRRKIEHVSVLARLALKPMHIKLRREP